jgi:TonB family protein
MVRDSPFTQNIVLSFLVHILIGGFLLFLFQVVQPGLHINPEVYKVSLVTLPVKEKPKKGLPAKPSEDLPKTTITQMKETAPPTSPAQAMKVPKEKDKTAPAIKTAQKDLSKDIEEIRKQLEEEKLEEDNLAAIAALQSELTQEGEAQEVPVEESGNEGVPDGTLDGEAGISENYLRLQYREQVRQKIMAAWNLPKWSVDTLPANTQALILVYIDEKGEILRTQMEKSSNIPFFDQSASRAIRRAAPLPPPPESLMEETKRQGIVMRFSPKK